MTVERVIAEAKAALLDADAVLIAAGAGMGVDSGLPDFRGKDGFWRAYPPYRHLGLGFTDLANPRWFGADPALAWGFYGHRLGLYRATRPHDGFKALLDYARTRAAGYFVFTSNVDGQFQAAGFDPTRIVECHGSIHHLQCTRPCSAAIWDATTAPDVDPTTMRAIAPLPTCPMCGRLARPNILMFGDGGWLESRSEAQEARLEAWLGHVASRRVVIIELGAGTAVATVRATTEWVARRLGARLIRLNVREPEGPPGAWGLPWRASEVGRLLPQNIVLNRN